MEKDQQGKLVSTWECVTKNKDDEPEVTTLHIYDFTNPDFDENNYLSQASPVKLGSPRINVHKRESTLVADVPDIHYGFRDNKGELDPTHCPEAMDVWLQVMKEAQPDIIIIGGDALDAPQISKYSPDSDQFVNTLQKSIDGLYKYLARIRQDNPNARIINLKGNHDERFEKTIIRNAMPLFGVRPANMPDDFAVNSLPFLLRFKDLGIEQESGFFKLNDKLITTHGDISKNGQSTASAYVNKLACSLMFHHTHRREYARRTTPDGHSNEAFSFGCLADTNGSVPSVHNQVDDFGRVVERHENWDNGGGFVEISEKQFRIDPVPIEKPDYAAMREQRIFEARQAVAEALSKGN